MSEAQTYTLGQKVQVPIRLRDEDGWTCLSRLPAVGEPVYRPQCPSPGRPKAHPGGRRRRVNRSHHRSLFRGH